MSGPTAPQRPVRATSPGDRGDGVPPRRSDQDQTRHLEQLLAAKEIVVACGPGGVGKTTISASLAATAAARLGGRVLVLTVDPARRLADALGLGGLGNLARRVPEEAFADAGVRPKASCMPPCST